MGNPGCTDPVANSPLPGNTKQRILFVDDEELILNLLRIALAPRREDWDTAFASSGAKALSLLDQTPFDVVVSDMCMPGMNGATLLNEVHKRRPSSIRIILSGYSDLDLVMKCVGVTHQFLSKPFDLHVFYQTLNRIGLLRERLRSPELRHWVNRQRALPTLPAVSASLSQALQDVECPLERIGAIINTDPGLAAKILQLANSPFFGFAREVTNPLDAVMLLGVATIRSLVLAVSLFGAFEHAPMQRDVLSRVWHHSVRVGEYAQTIARLENANEFVAQLAFTGGLLHDLAKLILARDTSGQHSVGLPPEVMRSAHADVGAYQLDLWGLPPSLVEVVAFHHCPSSVHDIAFSAVTAVHAADALAHEIDEPRPTSDPPRLDLEYLHQLNLEPRVKVWLKALEENGSSESPAN